MSRRPGRPTARRAGALLALACAAVLAMPAAQASAGLRGLVVQVDNDEFAGFDPHDRWYTSGVHAASIVDLQAGGAGHRLLDTWCRRIRCARDGEPLGFVAIGQNLYTQANRRRVVPLPGDRPIGAWLYLRGGAVMDGPKRYDMVGLEIGLTGPGALGQHTQDAVHDFIGVTRVPGWRYQLRPRTGISLQVQSARRIPLGGFADLVTEGRLHLGNLRTYLGAGIALRLGRALEGARLPAEAADSTPGLRSPAGWHGTVGMRARAVAFDGPVEGPAFGYSPTVRARPFVVESFVGIGYRFARKAELMFLLSRRSSDFSGASLAAGSFSGHTIGAIRFGWFFGP